MPAGYPAGMLLFSFEEMVLLRRWFY